jgi:hypothetical protein
MVLNLLVKLGVFDGDRGLVGKGLQVLDVDFGKETGRPAVQVEEAVTLPCDRIGAAT